MKTSTATIKCGLNENGVEPHHHHRMDAIEANSHCMKLCTSFHEKKKKKRNEQELHFMKIRALTQTHTHIQDVCKMNVFTLVCHEKERERERE